MRRVRAFLMFIAAQLLMAAPLLSASENAYDSTYVGSQACTACHASISATFSKTSMAHASGPAMENQIPGDFVHQPSGIHYRIYPENDRLWLSFEKSGDPAVKGKRELLYFIGSGRRGRTYLFSTDKFLFESPVNWYPNKGGWDMAPAYTNAREMPLNLPTFTSCLHCHVSEMQEPLKGTENRYPTPPFTHAGVSCERCHGPGKTHVAGGPIVNPAKLTPQRRDDVCMQCHMEGKVAIERPGRHIYNFRPGEDLSDYTRYFVLAEDRGAPSGAVSQVEALSQSICKKKTGDSMSCTSCHNPHYSPSAAERTVYYRGKCLACHGGSFAEKHHPTEKDCTSCHMPAAVSSDIVHTQVTDHRIPRRPVGIKSQVTNDAMPRLILFPPRRDREQDTRDLALAWASLAAQGIQSAASQAERLLKKATEDSPNDPAILSALAYFVQRRGDTNAARALYSKALSADPDSVDAATNLGVIDAMEGDINAAIPLWDSAFKRAPARSSIGMNLAKTFCAARQINKARGYTLRVLEFNPDMSEAKILLQHLNRTPPSCIP